LEDLKSKYKYRFDPYIAGPGQSHILAYAKKTNQEACLMLISKVSVQKIFLKMNTSPIQLMADWRLFIKKKR
jgi:hypothetical protein